MTLANKITLARFLLCLVLFGFLVPVTSPKDLAPLNVAIALFWIVALSDMLDGYVARKYGQITELGRIMDPMVDKILVCGVLIMTQRIPEVAALIPSWVIVVIVVREFAVSGVRAAAEAKGIPFPANAWGKLKAFAQNVLVGSALIYPAWAMGPEWTVWFTKISAWVAAVATIVSGAIYLGEARRVLKQ